MGYGYHFYQHVYFKEAPLNACMSGFGSVYSAFVRANGAPVCGNGVVYTSGSEEVTKEGAP
jgi:hypothetical protein